MKLNLGYILIPLVIFLYSNIHQKKVNHFIKVGKISLLSIALKIDALIMFIGTLLTIIIRDYKYLKVFDKGVGIFILIGVLMMIEGLIFGKQNNH